MHCIQTYKRTLNTFLYIPFISATTMLLSLNTLAWTMHKDIPLSNNNKQKQVVELRYTQISGK